MLAASRGKLVCLSTPYGKRGFFYEAWAKGGPEWLRVEVPANKIPRIDPEHIEEDRRALGESYVRQEYFCSFEALEGVVDPGVAGCKVDQLPRELVSGGIRGGWVGGEWGGVQSKSEGEWRKTVDTPPAQ